MTIHADDQERRVKDLGGCTVFTQWLCLHEAKPPPTVTSGSPSSITWHSFLQTTTSVVDGFNLSTFERTRWRSLKDGYSHPIPERCEGCLWRCAGPNRLRLCLRSLDDDYGTFPSVLRQEPSDSRTCRTPSATNKASPISDCSAPAFVEPSTGGWTGKN